MTRPPSHPESDPRLNSGDSTRPELSELEAWLQLGDAWGGADVDDRGVDDREAAEPRTNACLSLSRLDLVQKEVVTLTAAEREHVEECSLCAARLRAFGLPDLWEAPAAPHAAEDVPPSVAIAGSGGGWLRLLQGAQLLKGSLAAAAAIAFVALLWNQWNHETRHPQSANRDAAENRTSQETQNRGQGGEATLADLTEIAPAPQNVASVMAKRTGQEECERISITYLPDPQGSDAEVRIDAFHVTANKDCSMVVFLRDWDEDCGCLRWRLHDWKDQTRPNGCALVGLHLKAGESIALEVDVSDVPPFEQILMIATADRPEDLPSENTDANLLLDCLAGPCPDETPDADLFALLNDAPDCFPRGVNVCGELFVVR